jgi:branched-chain amino acid transport system substrate-binding protein
MTPFLLVATLHLAPASRPEAHAESPVAGVASPEPGMDARLERAEALRLAGDHVAARRAFAALRREGDASLDRLAALGLAVCDAAAGRASGNTIATLRLLGNLPGVPDTLEAERLLLLAEGEAARGGAPDRVHALVRDALRRIDDASPLRARVASLGGGAAPAPTAVAPETLAERMREALAQGRWNDAAALAKDLAAAAPGTALAREAEYAGRRAAAQRTLDPHRVLVLLPLTGDLAVPAGQIRDALALGAGPDVVLDVVDTKGDPAACVAALEAGVIERGDSLVVGPMRKEEALPCATAAQALRVPLVTLTSTAEGLSAGDHVFRGYLSVEQQIAALVDEAMGVRGMQRFAVLHPLNAFGEGAAAAFEAAVAARGGSIALKQGYPPDQKDYRSVALAFGRKDFVARAAELRAIKEDIKKKKGDPEKATLPPVVDYDAIFIPEKYQATALLASALAYEEFPIGTFRPRRDDKGVVLLGLNGWNNDDLAKRAGEYVYDSIFVDAFDADSQDPAVVDFVAAWRARGSGAPGLFAALGVDLGLLVRDAVAEGGGIAGLRAARVDAPVAGTEGFGADRQALRRLRLLTLGPDGVVPLPPPAPVEPTDAPAGGGAAPPP